MHIRLAKNIGFCSGVKRAIDIVEETLKQNKKITYSLGPVIHNPEVIRKLEKKNLHILNSLKELTGSSIVILPSHGSPQHILDTAKKKNTTLVDVTCPYVSSVQKICSALYKKGFTIIIVGDKEHPEIKALQDLAKGAFIIQDLKDIKENEFSYKRIGIISQTTQSKDAFFKIITHILKMNPKVKEVHIFNTICLDTIKRQEEVEELAKAVDTLLVIGSRTSANTKRLFGIGRKLNKKTYLVENKATPIYELLKKSKDIGIISGASTPQWLVKDIVKKIGGNIK